MAFQLPRPGDVQGQVQAGNDLINKIQTGDTASLLEAGISLAGNAIGGDGGAVLTDSIGGAMSGFAMAGPMGAVVGGIVGLAEGLSSVFHNADAVTGVLGVSDATNTITSAVASIQGKKAVLSGKPQGWAMADYLSFARPPSHTRNSGRFMEMLLNVSKYVVSTLPSGTSSIPDVLKPYMINDQGDPTNIANALCGLPEAITTNCHRYTNKQFVAWQQPLCTPVWFNWYNPSNVFSCDRDLLFGSGGAGGTVDQLKQTWIQSTFASKGLSQQQIVERAIAKAPDCLYWGADLYGVIDTSGLSGFQTTYINPDLINGVSTVLTMRSAGASTQAILSELLIQGAILDAHGDKDVSGNPLPGNVSNNRYGFQCLLDDHIRMAQNENAAAGLEDNASGCLSPAGIAGAVVAGATGAVLVGILGYSVVTKTSPVETTRLALARAGRLTRR